VSTIQNISAETTRALIDAMAMDIRPETDLAKEHHVIRDLVGSWAASTIHDHLDAVIERARALRQSEPLRDDSTGIAEWLRTTAAVSLAAAAWFGVWCALPEHAMAMTMEDAQNIILRSLYVVFGWVALALMLVGVAALIQLMRKPQPDDTWKLPSAPLDLEQKRRNAGGE